MHILVALITLLTVISIWYYRIRMLRDAARDGQKVVETVANLPRKMRFRSMSRKGGLDVVEDPREAATILMLELAQARGPLTEKQQAVIRAEIMQHFEFDEADAEQLIAQASWLARDGGAPHAIVARMTDFVLKSPGMSAQQMIDLDGMLVYVSEAEGSPTAEQLDLLVIYRQKAGLRV